MKRWLALHRAARSCDRAAELYAAARFWARLGDLCRAGRVKALADTLAGEAVADLEAAEPYLPSP